MAITPLKRTFGVLIQQILKQKKKRQGELAELLGISGAAISQVIHGKNSFNPKQLEAIIEWLKLSPEQADQLYRLQKDIRSGVESFMSDFNRTFFALRNAKGLSLEKVSESSGISYDRIVAFEKDNAAIPSYEEAVRLGKIFSCTTMDLLKDAEIIPDPLIRTTPPEIKLAEGEYGRRCNPVPVIPLILMKNYHPSMDPMEFACNRTKQLLLLRDRWGNFPIIAVDAHGTELYLNFSGRVRLILSEKQPEENFDFELCCTDDKRFIIMEKKDDVFIPFSSQKICSEALTICWSIPIVEIRMTPVPMKENGF
jgi:transcriptional regulator with XRE-family HTH domain